MKQPATPDHFRYSLLAIGLFASAILSGCMGAAPPAPESAAPAASASPSAAPSSPSASSGFAPYLVGIDIPEELREIERTGRISDAEAWINAKVRDAATPESLVVSLAAERQRLALLRRDFSRTPEQVLERLRKDMPSVSAWDLDRWQAAGVIQWLPIDGAPRYFRREPANLYRFCPEAKKLRDAAAKAQPQSTETAESTAAASALPKKITVPDVLAAADASETPIVLPVRMHARHVITVHPDLVPEGKIIRCWMPYPQEYQQQGDIRLIATDPPEHHIAANGSGQRTIYFERPAAPAGQPTVFTAEYEYTTAAYAPRIDPALVRPYRADDPIVARYTREQKPHIPLTPEVRRLAAEIVGGETNPYRKAEKIYRWMDENIRYASEMEYSIMPSVVEKIMATRKGDCGVQVLMLVALCRAAGVPARWQSGWATEPGDWNMHDWAEFYVEPYGWIPSDPSFGLRKSDNPRVRDFYIAALEPYRMIANHEIESPFDPPKKFWRSDPVDNQRGEVEWDMGNLYYDEWDYDVSVVPVSAGR